MSKIFLRKRAVADRYGVNIRTVDRWSEDGRLPPPIYRGITPLWDLSELDAQDHAAAAIARASGKLKTAEMQHHNVETDALARRRLYFGL